MDAPEPAPGPWEGLLLSGALVAAGAVGLTAASSALLGLPVSPSLLALAGLGTLAVYLADGLIDLARGREGKPRRRAFLARHRRAVALLALLAALGAAGFAWRSGAWPLATLVLLLALAHPWIQRLSPLKPVYLALAWLTVVWGLPLWLARAWPEGALALGLAWGLTLLAHALAGDALDRDGIARWIGRRGAWYGARGLAVGALGVALLGPTSLRPAAGVPLLTLLSLTWKEPGERRVGLGVDGALLAGSAVALLLARYL